MTPPVPVECADENCGHTLISHDLGKKAMPCRVPGCPCVGFIDRAWLLCQDSRRGARFSVSPAASRMRFTCVCR